MKSDQNKRGKNQAWNVAVIGATGVVGRELFDLLQERDFPINSIRALASSRSAGRTIAFRDTHISVEGLDQADPEGIDLAFFCAGAARSRAFARVFTAKGAWVIDNSSAFRREPEVPLVIPEINGDQIARAPQKLIANPNCSTIAGLLPLAALNQRFGLERVLVSTYQAVSGAGRAALEELQAQTQAAAQGRSGTNQALPRPIVHNLIPWIGEPDATGFCEEEQKIAFESRKILGMKKLKISATTVRVPVRRCHSLSIWVRLRQAPGPQEVINALHAAPGVQVMDPAPCPGEHEGADPVFVGRVRPDPDEDRAFWFWVVSDQLRKGAALNAIQIAERIDETCR